MAGNSNLPLVNLLDKFIRIGSSLKIKHFPYLFKNYNFPDCHIFVALKGTQLPEQQLNTAMQRSLRIKSFSCSNYVEALFWVILEISQVYLGYILHHFRSLLGLFTCAVSRNCATFFKNMFQQPALSSLVEITKCIVECIVCAKC